MTLMHCLSL